MTSASSKAPAAPAVRPLSIPAFRFFFAGQALSTIGDSLVPLALAFAVLELTSSPTTLGLVLLGSRIPTILFALIGGSLGDRLPRRSILLAADVCRFAVQAFAGWLLLAGQATPLLLGVLAALTGVGSAFFQPAAAGLLPSMVPAEALQRANAALGATRSGAQIGAMALSGVLVAVAGPGWAFIVDAVTFAGSAFFISFVKEDRTPASTARRGLLSTATGGWNEVRARPWLWLSMVHIALMNLLVIAPFLVLGPFIAERDLSGATSWAVLGTAGGVGGLIGNLVAARWKPHRPLMTTYVATLAVMPLLLLLAMPASMWLLAPAAALGLAQNSFFNVVHSTTVQTHIPNEALATVTSITMLGTLIPVPVGLALSGPVAQLTSTTTVLIVGACWVAIAGAAMAIHPSARIHATSGTGLMPGSGQAAD